MTDSANDRPSLPKAAKTFVLVHGAWLGGWCWARVARALRAAGHEVYTPTLTGLGERSHLLDANVNLETHISDVANVIKWEGLLDLVLVGHSYGGFVVAGVAELMPEKISSLVFLDAFMPKDGNSLVDMAAPPIRAAVLAATEKKQLSLPARPAAALQVNADDCAWVDALCTPHPVATFVNKIAIADDYKLIPRKTYIRAPAYENSAFDQAMIVRKEDPSWRTYTVPCGHRIMIDMPDRLVEILLG